MSKHDEARAPNGDGAAFEKAADLLSMSVDEARANSRALPDDAAVLVWNPIRGGGALLIDTRDLSVLYANSSVNPDEHLTAFRAGQRTDEALFGEGE